MTSAVPNTTNYIVWPKPTGCWSSIHGAAEACWRLAERERGLRDGGVDPQWLLSGALALALDVAEEVRTLNGLPLDATIADIIECEPTSDITGGQNRLDFVEGLLDYAIANEVLG